MKHGDGRLKLDKNYRRRSVLGCYTQEVKTMEFGKVIRDKRKQLNLTSTWVAERIGMHYKHFNNVELGRVLPMSDRYMPALAHQLKMSPGCLIALAAIDHGKVTLKLDTTLHEATGALLAERWNELGASTLKEINEAIGRHVERTRLKR